MAPVPKILFFISPGVLFVLLQKSTIFVEDNSKKR